MEQIELIDYPTLSAIVEEQGKLFDALGLIIKSAEKMNDLLMEKYMFLIDLYGINPDDEDSTNE